MQSAKELEQRHCAGAKFIRTHSQENIFPPAFSFLLRLPFVMPGEEETNIRINCVRRKEEQDGYYNGSFIDDTFIEETEEVSLIVDYDSNDICR